MLKERILWKDISYVLWLLHNWKMHLGLALTVCKTGREYITQTEERQRDCINTLDANSTFDLCKQSDVQAAVTRHLNQTLCDLTTNISVIVLRRLQTVFTERITIIMRKIKWIWSKVFPFYTFHQSASSSKCTITPHFNGLGNDFSVRNITHF